MSEPIHAPRVGAPDPEHGIRHDEGRFACSGDGLPCRRSGVWLRQGSCHPLNP